MRPLLLACTLALAACTSGDDAAPVTLEGVDPATDGAGLAPDATLRPDASGLAPEPDLAPEPTLEPGATLQPDSSDAP